MHKEFEDLDKRREASEAKRLLTLTLTLIGREASEAKRLLEQEEGRGAYADESAEHAHQTGENTVWHAWATEVMDAGERNGCVFGKQELHVPSARKALKGTPYEKFFRWLTGELCRHFQKV